MDPIAHPTKTDHFPIVTILELPQKQINPKPTYDFHMADWEDVIENLRIHLMEIPGPAPLLNDKSFQKATKDLTEALQDTIWTRIEIKRLVPQSRHWWNVDLKRMK